MQMQVLRAKLAQLNMSIAGAAALVGGSATALNQELNGVRPMSNDKFLKLDRDLTKLLEISAAVTPLTLDLKNIVHVRAWLELWTVGDLKINVTDLSNEPKKTAPANCND
jgi:hypothetical protein